MFSEVDGRKEETPLEIISLLTSGGGIRMLSQQTHTTHLSARSDEGARKVVSSRPMCSDGRRIRASARRRWDRASLGRCADPTCRVCVWRACVARAVPRVCECVRRDACVTCDPWHGKEGVQFGSASGEPGPCGEECNQVVDTTIGRVLALRVFIYTRWNGRYEGEEEQEGPQP